MFRPTKRQWILAAVLCVLMALTALPARAALDPALVQKLQTAATYPVGGSVKDARDFLAREQKLWAGAVKQADLKAE